MNDSPPSDLNTDYILGKIDGHLESIDQSLVDGKETMKGLQDSITDGFKEQKEEIHTVELKLVEHQGKGHYCHLANSNSEARKHGLRGYAPAVAKGGGVGAVIGGIIWVILKSVGWL